MKFLFYFWNEMFGRHKILKMIHDFFNTWKFKEKFHRLVLHYKVLISHISFFRALSILTSNHLIQVAIWYFINSLLQVHFFSLSFHSCFSRCLKFNFHPQNTFIYLMQSGIIFSQLFFWKDQYPKFYLNSPFHKVPTRFFIKHDSNFFPERALLQILLN